MARDNCNELLMKNDLGPPPAVLRVPTPLPKLSGETFVQPVENNAR